MVRVCLRNARITSIDLVVKFCRIWRIVFRVLLLVLLVSLPSILEAKSIHLRNGVIDTESSTNRALMSAASLRMALPLPERSATF